MTDLNPSERRALRTGVLLVLLGTAARLGLGPGEDAHAWRPAGTAEEAGPTLDSLRARVTDNRAAARRAATPLEDGERVDPNRAPPAELRRLPGVGPVTARAIVEARARRVFRWRSDLLRVRGIGPATLRRMEAHLDLPPRPRGAASAAHGTRPAGGAMRGPPSADGAPEVRGESPPGTPGTVDVNRAASADLQRLPGIGPVLAAEIIAWRSRNGGFGAVEELLEVRGIGPARLERLRPLVRVR